MQAEREAYFGLTRSIARQVAVRSEIHAYFEQHCDRLPAIAPLFSALCLIKAMK